jgi:hypothetical protein
MYRKLRFLAVNLGYALMGMSVAVAAAQPATCTALVSEALRAVDTNCTDLGRNSVCYGFNRVDASFFTQAEEGFFSEPADRAALTELASIQTAPLDVDSGQWGVAMMNVQANVPNTLPGQAVTFVLLGDARVENAVPPENAFVAGDPVRVVINTGARVNVRSGPDTTFNVIANADPGQLFDVDARNAAGDWLRVSGPTPSQWISRSLVTVQTGGLAQLDGLPVAPEEPLSPMQAFYFRTGIGAPQCIEAPDVLVVQGPKEVRVTLNVNGAEVAIGSTVAFKSGELSLGEVRADASLAGTVEGLDIEPESPCLVTELAILEGDALAPDGTFIPLGHKSQAATCLDTNRTPVFFGTWGDPHEMTDEEILEFTPLLDVPFPHYPLELPTRDQIEDSKRNGPDVKPEPTRLPRVQIAQPTARPNTAGTSNSTPSVTAAPGQPTATPTPQVATDPCAGFAMIGPGGVVNGFGQLFAWNFAQGATGYQLEISAYLREPVPNTTRLFRVGAEQNGINIDLSSVYSSIELRPSEIRWKLQVLVPDGQGNLTTACETPYQMSKVEYAN